MSVKICPSCGGKVAESRNDCIHCGYKFPLLKKCEECEENVDINVKECPVCGHVFEKEKDLPQVENPEKTLPRVSADPLSKTAIKEVYRLEKKLSKTDFFRYAMIEVCKLENIPSDIFSAKFNEVEELEIDAYIFSGNVYGNYSGSIGYDRQVEYITADNKRSTKTVTDWQPFSSSLSTAKDIVCCKERGSLPC